MQTKKIYIYEDGDKEKETVNETDFKAASV